MAGLFAPAEGSSYRDFIAGLLSAENAPFETMRSVAGLTARLMVEFERDSASTRLRGSPLLSLAVELLTKMHGLWYPDQPLEPGTVGAGGGPPGSVGAMMDANGAFQPSFAEPTLERIVSAAGHGTSLSMGPGGAGGGGAGTSGASVVDTRTVRGVIALLQTPNEGSGRLDGDGDDDIADRLESLRESARRVFYLITMEHADGTLRVPEAERRLTFFINSMYMAQMPTSRNVLEMPSFNVVTPQYNEAVIYPKSEFLTQVRQA
jgi:hypothetical protein